MLDPFKNKKRTVKDINNLFQPQNMYIHIYNVILYYSYIILMYINLFT